MSEFNDIINFIKTNTIMQYILVGLAIYFFLLLVLKIFGALINIFVFYWKQGYEERKKKRLERKKERLKWRYAKVKLDNPLLNQIISNRFIICKGGLGKGKSITMNLIAHFLVKSRERQNKKNVRYNKIMNYEYFVQEKTFKKNNILPIYSNLDFVEKKKHKQDLLPYLCLQKRACYKAVFCIDEVSSMFPKDMYYATAGQSNPLLDEMKELFKKNRHYTNGWILGTEQDGDDIFIGFRKNGYALINCLGTAVKISTFGKILRKILNFFNLILPAFLTANYARLLRENLFLKDKCLMLLKMLLPSYYLLPKEYYTRKQEINNFIKLKFQKYATKFQFENNEYYIRYTNKDIYRYDTRAYKNEYAQLFDKNGERKKINE